MIASATLPMEHQKASQHHQQHHRNHQNHQNHSEHQSHASSHSHHSSEAKAWTSWRTKCIDALNKELGFSSHFFAQEADSERRILLRVATQGIFWIPEPTEQEEISLEVLDDRISETKEKVLFEDFHSCKLSHDSRGVRLATKGHGGKFDFISDDAPEIQDSILKASLQFADEVGGGEETHPKSRKHRHSHEKSSSSHSEEKRKHRNSKQFAEVMKWADLKPECIWQLNTLRPHEHHFFARQYRADPLLVRINQNAVSWIPEMDGHHMTSIKSLDEALSHTTTLIPYDDLISCALVADENVVQLKRKTVRRDQPEIVNFIFDDATRIRQIILEESHQTVSAEIEEVYDPEEFKWLCSEFYHFVASHHFKGRKHIPISSASDALATQEAQGVLLEVKLAGRMVLVCLPLIVTIVGFIFSLIIGEAIITHKVRDKVRSFIKQRYIHASKHGRLYFRLHNNDDAPIFYYNGNHFGVVEFAELNQGASDEKPVLKL